MNASGAITAAGDFLRGRRVLITGGSGFIGCRLAERLALRHGAEVRVLVRDIGRALRVATLPVELVRGSILDPVAVEAAVRGCDTVFHCAYGTAGSQGERSRTNLDGTRQVLEASGRAGARRIIDLSTLMVYGESAPGDLDETAPRRRFGESYADSKRAAEAWALTESRSRGLPVVVLQPTAVYGPYGGVWTETPLRQLQANRLVLVDGGRGLANAVYVDDLVSAMLLAAHRDEAVGQAFLISGAESEPWSAFYRRFAAMLPGAAEERFVEWTRDEALSHWRRHRWHLPSLAGALIAQVRTDRDFQRSIGRTREVALARQAVSAWMPEAAQAWLKRGAKSLLERRSRAVGGSTGPVSAGPGGPPVLPLSPRMIAFFALESRVRIDKARRLLGYEPQFSLSRGMELTERWARWANLIPSN